MRAEHNGYKIEVFLRRARSGVFEPYGTLAPPLSPDGMRPFMQIFDPCESYGDARTALRRGRAFAVDAIECSLA
jgi:hypothetical protein